MVTKRLDRNVNAISGVCVSLILIHKRAGAFQKELKTSKNPFVWYRSIARAKLSETPDSPVGLPRMKKV